jgi:hypothetical protein
MRTCSGSYVDNLSFECGAAPFISSMSSDYFTSWGGNGFGGAELTDWCPNNQGSGWNGTGYLVDRVILRAGDYIDEIKPLCSYVAR